MKKDEKEIKKFFKEQNLLNKNGYFNLAQFIINGQDDKKDKDLEEKNK